MSRLFRNLYFIYNFLAEREERPNNFGCVIYLRFLIKFMKRILVTLVIFILRFRLWRNSFILVNPKSTFIVSITSFPGRIKSVWLTLLSLSFQTEKPAVLALYLSTSEFPMKHEDLPRVLLKLIGKRLKVFFVDDNLKSHKKYFYALQEYPDKVVITIDDDLLYPHDTFARLLQCYHKYPNCVIANRATRISIENSVIQPYRLWQPQFDEGVGLDIVAIGCGGVLYPPFFNKNPETFNSSLIKRLAPLADDLWLKAIQLTKGICVAKCAFFPHPMVVPGTNSSSLANVNVRGEALNDSQFTRLVEHFDLERKLLP